MSIDELRSAIPAYAIDQKLNLDAVLSENVLTDQQKWGCALCCACMTREPWLIANIEAEATEKLSEAAIRSAKSAATIMAMNTVYYGAIDLIENHDYRAQPVRLSMTALTQTEVEKLDFELWAFAASATAGCGACLNVHEAELHKRGVSIARVQAALRIAATISGVATAIATEARAS